MVEHSRRSMDKLVDKSYQGPTDRYTVDEWLRSDRRVDCRSRSMDRGVRWLVEVVDFDGELHHKLSTDTIKE